MGSSLEKIKDIQNKRKFAHEDDFIKEEFIKKYSLEDNKDFWNEFEIEEYFQYKIKEISSIRKAS